MSIFVAKIKVAFLIPGFNLFGQEKALLAVANTLKEDGIDVIVFIHHEFGIVSLADAIVEMGFRCVSLPLNTIWSPRLLVKRPIELWRNACGRRSASRKFHEVIEAEGVDVFITGNWSFAYYLLPALRKLNVPFIYRHGDSPPISNFISQHIAKAVFSCADIHIANCNFVRRKLIEFGLSTNIEVIRNLVEIPIKKTLLTCSTHGKVNRLLFAGQISIHKGAIVLLDAFDLLATKYPELHLVLAGAIPGVNNSSPSLAIERMRESQVRWGGRVKYVGHVSNISDLFTERTIHVCPSVWDDPSPNIIFEAKAHSTPSVAFNRGGIPELINNGVDGIIEFEETPEALACAITALIDDESLFIQSRIEARKSLDETFNECRRNKQWPRLVRGLVATKGQSDL